MLTDAEVEQHIKDRFAHSRMMLDLQEKYYTEFRKVLSPKQIEKIYQMEKKHDGNRMRKDMRPDSKDRKPFPQQKNR